MISLAAGDDRLTSSPTIESMLKPIFALVAGIVRMSDVLEDVETGGIMMFGSKTACYIYMQTCTPLSLLLIWIVDVREMEI